MINNTTITCNVNFKGKEIVLKNLIIYMTELRDLSVCSFIIFFWQVTKWLWEIKRFYDNLLRLKHYYESLKIGKIYFNIECDFKRHTREVSTRSANSKGVISTFTGGVDSFYTLLTKYLWKFISKIMLTRIYDISFMVILKLLFVNLYFR